MSKYIVFSPASSLIQYVCHSSYWQSSIQRCSRWPWSYFSVFSVFYFSLFFSPSFPAILRCGCTCGLYCYDRIQTIYTAWEFGSVSPPDIEHCYIAYCTPLEGSGHPHAYLPHSQGSSSCMHSIFSQFAYDHKDAVKLFPRGATHGTTFVPDLTPKSLAKRNQVRIEETVNSIGLLELGQSVELLYGEGIYFNY